MCETGRGDSQSTAALHLLDVRTKRHEFTPSRYLDTPSPLRFYCFGVCGRSRFATALEISQAPSIRVRLSPETTFV